jgi:hypothetical protein
MFSRDVDIPQEDEDDDDAAGSREVDELIRRYSQYNADSARSFNEHVEKTTAAAATQSSGRSPQQTYQSYQAQAEARGKASQSGAGASNGNRSGAYDYKLRDSDDEPSEEEDEDEDEDEDEEEEEEVCNAS